MKRCGSCYWFEEHGTGSRVQDGKFQGAKTGECWLNPPILMMAQAPVKGSHLTPQGMQLQPIKVGEAPPTHEERRCHEWTSRKDLNG